MQGRYEFLTHTRPPRTHVQRLTLLPSRQPPLPRTAVNGVIIQILTAHDEMVLDGLWLMTDRVIEIPIPGSVLKYIRFSLQCLEDAACNLTGTPGDYFLVIERKD